MQNDRFRRRKGRFLFAFFFPLLWALLIAVVMWLWNAILPSLLHVSAITYWQAAGLFLLCRILFGGFHFRPRGDFKQRFEQKFSHERWNEMRDKLKNMSEEDRAKFKSQMRDKWCQMRGEEKKESGGESQSS